MRTQQALRGDSVITYAKGGQCTQWNSTVIALHCVAAAWDGSLPVCGGRRLDIRRRCRSTRPSHSSSPTTHCSLTAHRPLRPPTNSPLTTHHSAALRATGAHHSDSAHRSEKPTQSAGPQRGAVRGMSCGEWDVRLLREQLQRLRLVTCDAIRTVDCPTAARDSAACTALHTATTQAHCDAIVQHTVELSLVQQQRTKRSTV